ncbi:hypothetical protein SAMN05192574_101798 [Mucilaginibacter gossypiicola]|uniref:Uncharacterized protein n=1 Tax=Mucilaginibacter gossypiicola TaxID=551995 RepID=A0A1H8B7J4_9SPHI|nr:hypothetical protein SAMN05192574_101798 [Mucilaginibacter gossypiicola]
MIMVSRFFCNLFPLGVLVNVFTISVFALVNRPFIQAAQTKHLRYVKLNYAISNPNR